VHGTRWRDRVHSSNRQKIASPNRAYPPKSRFLRFLRGAEYGTANGGVSRWCGLPSHYRTPGRIRANLASLFFQADAARRAMVNLVHVPLYAARFRICVPHSEENPGLYSHRGAIAGAGNRGEFRSLQSGRRNAAASDAGAGRFGFDRGAIPIARRKLPIRILPTCARRASRASLVDPNRVPRQE